MQVVYFPEELHQAAPAIIGHFCVEPTGDWLTLIDVVQVFQAGHTVTIRHATDNELKRAEAFVALYQVGQQLAAKMNAVLDFHPPEKAAEAKAAFEDALSVDGHLPGILDTAEE